MNQPLTAAVRFLSGEREPVRVATTGNLSSMQGLLVIDDVELDVGDRVLVKDQTDAVKNGIWLASEGIWFRAPDASYSRAINEGVTVGVQEGTVNNGRTYRFASSNPVVGVDPISIIYLYSDGAGFASAAQGAKADTALQPASIGVSLQAFDAGLTSIAGLTTSANQMIYTTGADAYATTALTPFARTILDDTDSAGVLSTLQFSHANSYTAGSAGAKFKKTVFVTDAPFNAVMDGTTNDAAALQAAIDYVFGLGGGCVLIPPGVMAIGAVTLKPGVDLYGAGVNATGIRPISSGLILFSSINAVSTGTNVRVGNFNIHCEVGSAKTTVTGFKFVFCNRVTLENIAFYGCHTNFDFDRGGLIRILDCVSGGTTTLKAGSFFMGSTDDSVYGASFSDLQNYHINNSGTGTQSPACYFRRCVAVEMSILANDGDYTGICIAVENDCQGINITGLIPAYGVGLYLHKGSGIDKAPIFNDFRGLDFDQCGTNAILVEAGEHNKFGGMVTSSFVNVDGKAVVFTSAAAKNNIIDHMHVSGYFDPGGSALLLSNTTGNLISGFKASGCYNGIEFDGTNTDTMIQGGSVSESVTNPVLGTYTGTGNRILDLAGFDVPWQSYTPTITAGSGTFTSVSATGKYRQIDSVMHVSITITITTNGTAASNIRATLPAAAVSAAILAGKESAVAGSMFVGLIPAAETRVFVNRYDGVYGAANGYVITIAGSYEVA